MPTITVSQIQTAILIGELDISLDAIKTIIKSREEMLQNKLKRSLSVGNKVKFNSSTKPIYMRGMVATITKINRERIVVNMDNPVGRFRNNVTVPISLVEAV